MKYKIGDKVQIKSIDWYNENKDEYGCIDCSSRAFFAIMCQYCGKILTINSVDNFDKKYKMTEDGHRFDWTDEMIEGLVKEETKPKFKAGDKVIFDTYPCVVTDVNWRDSLHGFVYTVKGVDFRKMVGEENLIFDTSDEETSKFKVNDIVFVKNIGLVRITNSYWDSLANEYIYEAIGLNGESEYDSIKQSNIGYLMLSESMIPHTCGNKITLDEYKNNDKEWLFNKLAMLDNITALESIQDIFNHLQQSKYPKTYEECCEVLGIGIHGHYALGYKSDTLSTFQNLIICRDAYWKIAGEEMGLDEPWKPDYDSGVNKYGIICMNGVVQESNPTTNWERHLNKVLDFPTTEMRDAFKENFDPDIEICKELL